MKNLFSKNRPLMLGIISVSLFLLLWEIAAKVGLINPFFTGEPSQIVASGYRLFSSGEIFPHLEKSLLILFSGLISAMFFGAVLGVLIGFYDNLYYFFRPFVFALNSLPMVAIVPLVILWFGIGDFSKIFVVFLLAIKPVLINSIDGARNTSGILLRMGKSFGAKNLFMLKKISWPQSLPFIFSGLRLSVGRGIIGLVLAEFFGYGLGLGFLVLNYGMTFKANNLMFVVLLLIAINVSIIGLISWMRKRIIKREYNI